MPETTKLKRAVGLPALIFFGVGTMVGGGFYALLGEVAQEAGPLVPLALGLAGLIALLSGLSFAELSSRFPVSAGIERYVAEGFDRRWLAVTVGYLVIATGTVSAATLSVATVGFLDDLLSWSLAGPISEPAATVLVVLALATVAAWGISESVLLVAAITVVEVGTLILVFVLNAEALPQLPNLAERSFGARDAFAWIGVFTGAFLAFYAFIGFEDMVPMAEETKDPRRTMPKAILWSVIVTTLLYVVVSAAGIAAVPLEEIAGAKTPIAVLVQAHGDAAQAGVGVVSLLAGINGALAQVIMISRVSFGMARRGDAPGWLYKVNPHTRTPVRSTASLSLLVMAFALLLPLQTLAEITSGIVLLVFAITNLALWRIKGSRPDRDGIGPRFPRGLILLGFVTCAIALAGQIWFRLSGAA